MLCEHVTASVLCHTQAPLHPLDAEVQQFLIVLFLDLQALHIAQCHCLLETPPVCIMLPSKQSIWLMEQAASIAVWTITHQDMPHVVDRLEGLVLGLQE